MRQTALRMASSLQAGQAVVGRTGTSYLLQKVLYERKENDNKDSEAGRKLWLAHVDDTKYVVKPVTSFLYGHAFKLQKEISSPFLHLPVDGSDANIALIFEYYTEDFLSFIQSGPTPSPQIKHILFNVLKGIASLHGNGWLHCDIKPNNILISYTRNSDGSREIHNVHLSDIEDAAKVGQGGAVFTQVGNVLWRSPEAQAGVNVRRPSDIWSFGVTAIYGMTKLVVFAYEEPEGEEIVPEVAVLANMISYFGPLPQTLVDYVKDSPWSQVLVMLSHSFSKEHPRKPFSMWKGFEGLEPKDKEFFGLILNLDPGLRPTAEELLERPWFSS